MILPRQTNNYKGIIDSKLWKLISYVSLIENNTIFQLKVNSFCIRVILYSKIIRVSIIYMFLSYPVVH
jgi:hypothetical protein